MASESESRIEALRLVPLFADLSDEQLTLLAQHAGETNIQAGDVLVREGDTGDRFILLLSGNARVERGGQVLAHLARNQFVGEMSLLDGKPRAATVTAENTCSVLIINRDTFRTLMDTVPEFREKLITVLCERLRGLQAPRPGVGQRPAPQPLELDHLYVYGEIYDALDTCDQVSQVLSRLRRHGLLSPDDAGASEAHVDKIRERLEQQLSGSPSSAAGS